MLEISLKKCQKTRGTSLRYLDKNRLCSKTCGMEMNAGKKKIWKYMKNPRER